MIKRVGSTALAVSMLAGCADTTSLDEARRASEEGLALFAVADEVVDFEAIPSAVPAGMAAEAFEYRQWTMLEAECLNPHNGNVLLLLNEMVLALPADKARVLEYGAREASKIEEAFAACGRTLGLTASTKERLRDGREMSIAELFQRAIPFVESRERALSNYARSLDEQERFWTAVGAAFAAAAGGYARAGPVNPSQVWIVPYYRTDGTRVSSHWRTTPNAACVDNIRGCR